MFNTYTYTITYGHISVPFLLNTQWQINDAVFLRGLPSVHDRVKTSRTPKILHYYNNLFYNVSVGQAFLLFDKSTNDGGLFVALTLNLFKIRIIGLLCILFDATVCINILYTNTILVCILCIAISEKYIFFKICFKSLNIKYLKLCKLFGDLLWNLSYGLWAILNCIILHILIKS